MYDMQEMFAERIGGKNFGRETVIYKFEKIKRARRQVEQEHPEVEIIDLGVGEPDDMADQQIVNTLYEEAKRWENRGYADNGILPFQEAAADYMKDVFKVEGLQPKTEILHIIGSKSALSMIPQAFINAGDVTLMTVPGYGVIGTKTKWLDGEVYPLPLLEKNNFLPVLEEIPEEIAQRAKLLYINYPNNPTGATATREFYEKVIAFAKKYQIIVIQDAAYSALSYGKEPFSFLSVPGAKEVGIEVHSLSKSYNMTGWRLGFIAGNEKIVKAIGMVKDNSDSGQFKAIQYAGAYALKHPEITAKICEKYERRHEMLSAVLRKVGFTAEAPCATFYEYIKIPKGTEDGVAFESAEQFTEYLLKHAYISTVPWDDAGHYVRMSVTFIADGVEEERRIVEEIGQRLGKCKFIF